MTARRPRLDPVTVSVIKHRLWQINEEQAIAIKTISSSPIVVEGNDFNNGLFTADGDLVTAGTGSLVHVGTMAPAIRNILRTASSVQDGDVFLTNDPYLGALHHNDVVMASPLWRRGHLVMWVANILHHPDVGGIDEGSFCINARTIFQEPPRYFLKIVDAGRLVPEVEHTFIANSRLPDMVALDLRAQLGGIHAAKERLHALCDEYGDDLVAQVMTEAIADAEHQVRARLAEIPDGSWSVEAFMDGIRVGCEDIVRVRLRLTKQGDALTFDYTGSDPQVEAAVNCTYHATVAGTAVPLYTFLCGGEIDWNDGLLRCLSVIAPEGTVVNARFPAPVSICTIGFRSLVTAAAAHAVAQMFAASPEHAHRVCPSWIPSNNCNNLFAIDSAGRRVGALLSDHRGGGAGARAFADGYNHAGQITSYASYMGNVESTEWKLPVLYLFRRQLPDSGGPGKYRGGLTAMVAMVPYRAREVVLKSTNTAGAALSGAAGVCGGLPGAGSQVTLVRGSQVWERLRAGWRFYMYEDFGGEVVHLPTKAEAALGPDDVLLFYPPGGGGYGDPLERDPDRVTTDVACGYVTQERAATTYGVVLDTAGRVDLEATERLRAELRRQRAQGELCPFTAEDLPLLSSGRDPLPRPVGDTLELAVTAAGPILRCRRCGHEGWYRRRLLPLHVAGPWVALRWRGDSPSFQLEEHSCPGCGVLFAVQEVPRAQALVISAAGTVPMRSDGSCQSSST